MIKDSDGSLAASCNGSNGAECLQVFVEEEEEFMMDTEEHRRILGQTNKFKGINYKVLTGGNPACGGKCTGAKYINPRGCFTYNRCRLWILTNINTNSGGAARFILRGPKRQVDSISRDKLGRFLQLQC
nr:hypothetical protein [Tanacetum cinerariifolium]